MSPLQASLIAVVLSFIGMTALAKPEPRMNRVKKNWLDSTSAARCAAPRRPTMTTSVV